MSNVIEVARYKDTVYTRVIGLGNFNNAGPFKEYVDAMIASGARKVIVDMGRCIGLDSTFMGTMVGFMCAPLGDGTCAGDVEESQVSVTIVNKTPATDRAIKSLGLPEVLDVRDEMVEPPPIAMECLRPEWVDAKRRVILIKKAHENLIELDPENEARFKPFLDMLMKDINNREDVD